MKKALKIFLWIIISFIVLLVIGALLLMFLVNPNDYKSQISHAFYRSTGRTMQINGPLSWSFFPSLGIDVTHISIDNPKGLGIKDFAKVDALQLSVDVLPLLSSTVHINRLVVKGLTLNLIESSPTANNWHFSTKSTSAIPVKKSSTAVSRPQPPKPASDPIDFAVKTIVIESAKVNYHNLATHSAYGFTLVKAQASHVRLGQAFPLTATMIFQGKTLLHPIHVALNTQVLLPTTLDGLSMKPLSMTLDQRKIKGEILLEALKTNPHIVFNLKANQLNVAQYVDLKGAGLSLSDLAVTGNITANALKTPMVNTLNGNVAVTTGPVVLQGISIAALIQKKNDLLTSLKGKQVDVGNVLATLHSGFLAAQQVDGRINPNNGQQTSIPSINIQATLKQGVVHNDHLLIANQAFFIEGQGTVDLTAKSTLNYRLVIGDYKDEDINGKHQRVKGPVPIPFVISGTRAKPHYAIDRQRLGQAVEQYLVSHAKSGLIKGVQEHLQEEGKALLKGLFNR